LTVRYFDSSAILSELLEEEGHPRVHELWDDASERLSSSLLKIECIIAIRRATLLQGFAPDHTWAQKRIDLLSDFLDALNFKAIDGSIEEIIRLNPALADCRTLDAIHVATALHFRPYVGGPLEIVTLDRRMKLLARKVGFKVQPED
jgi:predicted nucleic acid-binding protein